jgi:hypothetical protein
MQNRRIMPPWNKVVVTLTHLVILFYNPYAHLCIKLAENTIE